MANESQYYNPIIQSMVAAHQGQLDRDKLKAQMDQHKAEQKLRETQLGLEQTRIEHEHEHQLNLAELARQAHELTATVQKFANLKNANDLSRGGVDVGAALKSAGLPAMEGIPDYETQQQNEINHIKNTAAAQITATRSAGEPFDIAAEERKNAAAKELHQLDMNNRLEEAHVHTTSAEKIAQLNADKMESVARINGGYHLQGIRMMHQLGMGDQSEQAKQLVDGIFAGNRDYKTLTPDEKRVVESYASGTGELASLPTNQKDYQKKLEALGGVQTLINQYRDLAVNFSRDAGNKNLKLSPKDAQIQDKSKTAGTLGGTTGNQVIDIPLYGTAQRTVPGSDLESKLNSMKASGGQLATYFDQQNRKSDAEILRQVIGSFDPKATVKQNLQKLEQHTQQMQGAVKRTFGNMLPDRQNQILQQVGITDLGPEKAAGGPEEYVRDASGKLVLKQQ